ncbi:MAG TPA: hypothetical protein DCO86_00315 [Spirochaetaceae bacterium]|nr:hypothetical protein [Spirochaetaceae bacterium]
MKRIARLKQTIALDIITIIAWLCLLSIASIRFASDIMTIEKTARFRIAIAVAVLSLFWITRFALETRKDFKELEKSKRRLAISNGGMKGILGGRPILDSEQETQHGKQISGVLPIFRPKGI